MHVRCVISTALFVYYTHVCHEKFVFTSDFERKKKTTTKSLCFAFKILSLCSLVFCDLLKANN